MTHTRDPEALQTYLQRLDSLAADLPATRRAELVQDVREHVRAALLQRPVGASESVFLLGVLDRLGTVEEIVGQERVHQEGHAALIQQDFSDRRSLWLDVLAVLLLTFGGFLALVGWFAGALLLWSSPTWRLRSKLLGTLVWPFGLVAPLLTLAMGSPVTSICVTQFAWTEAGEIVAPGNVSHCSTDGGPWWLGLLTLLLVMLAVAAHLTVMYWLLRQTRRR